MKYASTLRQALRAAWFGAVVSLAACGGDVSETSTGVVAEDPAATSRVTEWALPAMPPGSGSPDLVASGNGRVLLGWINSQPGRRHVLRFDGWSPEQVRWMHPPATIAIGSRMHVDPVDVPHLAGTPDGALWAHWGQGGGEGRARDIVLTRSRDGGTHWAAPALPYDDARGVHGFAAMWAQGNSRLGIAWLTQDGTGREGPAIARLRAAVFDADLRRVHEAQVGEAACADCPAAVAETDKGPLLVYFRRDQARACDIRATRFDGNRWQDPYLVHADGWAGPAACTADGPDAAADGSTVVVGWFTGDEDLPEIRLVHSADAGDTFAVPVVLDHGAGVRGPVRVALDGGQAWVLWLRGNAGVLSLWLSRRSPDLATEHARIEVARLEGTGDIGVPRMVVREGVAHVVWTDTTGDLPILRGARVSSH